MEDVAWDGLLHGEDVCGLVCSRPLAVLGERLLPGNLAGGISAGTAHHGVEYDARACHK